MAVPLARTVPSSGLGGCFAGQCDWRLPTIYELQTILREPYPCMMSPCLDETVLGPAVADYYWSATTFAWDTVYAWSVDFAPGTPTKVARSYTTYVRAVRAGL